MFLTRLRLILIRRRLVVYFIEHELSLSHKLSAASERVSTV